MLPSNYVEPCSDKVAENARAKIPSVQNFEREEPRLQQPEPKHQYQELAPEPEPQPQGQNLEPQEPEPQQPKPEPQHQELAPKPEPQPPREEPTNEAQLWSEFELIATKVQNEIVLDTALYL